MHMRISHISHTHIIYTCSIHNSNFFINIYTLHRFDNMSNHYIECTCPLQMLSCTCAYSIESLHTSTHTCTSAYTSLTEHVMVIVPSDDPQIPPRTVQSHRLVSFPWHLKLKLILRLDAEML